MLEMLTLWYILEGRYELQRKKFWKVKFVQSSVLIWITLITAICVGLIVVRGEQYVNLQLLYNNNENNDKNAQKQAKNVIFCQKWKWPRWVEKYVEFLFLEFIKLT